MLLSSSCSHSQSPTPVLSSVVEKHRQQGSEGQGFASRASCPSSLQALFTLGKGLLATSYLYANCSLSPFPVLDWEPSISSLFQNVYSALEHSSLPHQEQSSHASQEFPVCFLLPTFLPLRQLHITHRTTSHPSPSLGQTQLSLPNRLSPHLLQDSLAPKSNPKLSPI